jgi:aminoglycoside phosphotransferase (APT) family kinase protein
MEWASLPDRIRAAVEGWLGAPVAAAETQPNGFSPGVAARLRTASGRRCFVKALGPEPNPESPTYHRREAAIVSRMPLEAPVPRLLWQYDEGEGGWVLLLYEDVEGRHPEQPWCPRELERVVATLIELSADLTPSPFPARSAAAAFAEELDGWKSLQAAPLPGLDQWSLRHLDRLAELEAAAPAAAAGATLLHLDLRADNLLLTPDRVYVVDWPHACVGAAWVDLLVFAPSVTMQGGPPPEELLQRHPAARAADPDAVTAVVAALAGFFIQRSLLPPPPGLPTLRPFQAAQGEVARRWTAERTGLW